MLSITAPSGIKEYGRLVSKQNPQNMPVQSEHSLDVDQRITYEAQKLRAEVEKEGRHFIVCKHSI